MKDPKVYWFFTEDKSYRVDVTEYPKGTLSIFNKDRGTLLEEIPIAIEKIMTLGEKRKHCVGCEDNFYNGQNPYGVEECWSLKSAYLMLCKKVSINAPPPWNNPPAEYLNCYKQKGYVFFAGDRKEW